MVKRQSTKTKATKSKPSNGANLGFEAQLWEAADKLCNNVKAPKS